MVTLSFPGIGIEEFSLDPVAFSIPLFGGIEIRWYGLIITLGIILAFTYCAWRAKQESISFDHLLDIAIFTIIFGVLGARAYYVLLSLDSYDSFYDVIAIWNGGLAIYGGIIAGALTIFIVCKIKKIKPLKMLDAVAPAVMIGQILGRWGNFFNGEAYGTQIHQDSFLYFARMGISPHNIEGVRGMAYVHPTFLYESLWNLAGFILIHFLYKKKKFDGQVLLMYLGWYGFGRMFIEGLRTDSLSVGEFRISQVVGFLCFVISALLLIIGLAKAHRQKLTDGAYDPTYAKISGYTATTASPSADAVSVEHGNDATIRTEQDAETETVGIKVDSDDTPNDTDGNETEFEEEEITEEGRARMEKRLADLFTSDRDEKTNNNE